MKKILALLPLVFVLSLVANGQQTGKITPSGIGYLEYLPDGYNSSQDKFPVVISLHGYKEKGTASNDPKEVLRDLEHVAKVGLPKYVKSGQKYPFILISPQLKKSHGTWPASYVMEVVNHVRKTLRIDDARIYLTGLSLGGFGVWKTAGEYPHVFAAIAPVCSGGNALSKADAIAKENLPVWGFHGSSDHVVSYTVSSNMINAINSAPKKPNPLAKLTIFPGMGHIIWDKAYQQTGVLDWMLSFRKGSKTPAPPTNRPPVVNAGQDQIVSLPSGTIHLEANASDDDGEIVSYHWTKASGPQVTMSDVNERELTLSNVGEGVYHFRVTVKDNDGESSSDDVSLTIKAKPASENKAPIARAGADITLTLPDNAAELSGSGADEDGSIKSYLWTKISGGSATWSEATSQMLRVSGLSAGTYKFKLTVTDNEGAIGEDIVAVIVRNAAQQNENSVEIIPIDYSGNRNTWSRPATLFHTQPWFSGD